MEKTPDPPKTFSGFVQWATTPPQAYGMYLILLVLVGGMSFYAGYLRPKKPIAAPSPPAIVAPSK